MKKLTIKGRGRNSRRPFRMLNSVTDLVGKDVEVVEGDSVTEATVENVSVDSSKDVTLTTDDGDQVILDSEEAQELIDTGTVATEDEADEPKETTEFDVTREVVDEDGASQEVTTTVAAEDEADAVKTIKTLDSKRGRNSRNFRVCNSDSASGSESTFKFDTDNGCIVRVTLDGSSNVKKVEVKKEGQLNDAFVEIQSPWIGKILTIQDIESLGNDSAEAFRTSNSDAEPHEFKIVRVADCDGKKIRKIASVTAPTVDEAIEAVKANDVKNEIKADGYEELVEKLPEENVVINSDVEEEIVEEPTDTIEMPADTETETETTIKDEKDDETPDENETETETETEVEVDRESNSYKGVSDFVKRKYGVNL